MSCECGDGPSAECRCWRASRSARLLSDPRVREMLMAQGKLEPTPAERDLAIVARACDRVLRQ